MARAVREADRLDVPGRRKRSTIPTIKVDREAFGKFAEAFARFMGTARFLFGMTVVIVIWILWNVPFGPPRPRFDPYPFIFLTLVLSPSFTLTTSFSLTSTTACMWLRSATRITSVPANWLVATSRSPSLLFKTVTVPSIGE